MQAPVQPRPYCYNEPAKNAQSMKARRFFRAALQLLPDEFSQRVHFNRGGIAVWGETYCKFYVGDGETPVVEAFDTSMGILVRQWDGKNSGANRYAQTLEQFVSLVLELSAKPFVRF